MRRYDFITLAFGGTVFFFVFSVSLFFFSVLSVPRAAAEGVPPAAHTVTPLEIHIANNGLVLLRSARVVATSGNTVTVSTTWGSADFRWIVDVSNTRFLGQNGKSLSFADVRVGEQVTVTGMLDDTAQEPTLRAESLRIL